MQDIGLKSQAFLKIPELFGCRYGKDDYKQKADDSFCLIVGDGGQTVLSVGHVDKFVVEPADGRQQRMIFGRIVDKRLVA